MSKPRSNGMTRRLLLGGGLLGNFALHARAPRQSDPIDGLSFYDGLDTAMRQGAIAGRIPDLAPRPIALSSYGRTTDPRDFGAVGDGANDDTSAISAALRTLGVTGGVLMLKGIYRLTAPIQVLLRKGVAIVGQPGRRCGFRIEFNGHDCLSLYGAEGSSVPLLIQGIFIGRDQAPTFTGTRLLAVSNISRLSIDKIELFHSAGFSFLGRDVRGGLFARSYVHDNMSGSSGHSGTDGIHFYEGCQNIVVYANTIERVGDDAISFGSYKGTKPNVGAVCVKNIVRNVAGTSIKLYGALSNAVIAGNQVNRAAAGGVTLWDDRDEGQSYDISNVAIVDNVIQDSGGPATSAGVYLTMTKGNGRGQMRNILIARNTLKSCKYGVTAASFVETKKFWNLRILKNVIGAPSTGTAILIKGLANQAIVQGNQLVGSGIRPIVTLDASAQFIGPGH